MNVNPMHEVLVRSFQGRATKGETDAIHRWRSVSEENDESYRAFAAVWRVTALCEEAVRSTPPTAAEVSHAAARRIARRVNRTRLRRLLLPAATIVLSFCGGALLFHWATGGLSGVGETSEVSTGGGESATVTLSDGTAIRVGPNTNLRLMKEGVDWVAWLDGLAFFGVVPDQSTRFTVRTAHGEATALGTRFEVRTEPEELRVLVVEGNVRVSSGGTAVDLGEGLLSRSSQGLPPSATRVEDVDIHLDWMGLALLFRDTRLERAISETAYRYGVSIILENPDLRDLPVTATFTDQPVEGVVFVICEIVGAVCTVEGDAFRIGDMRAVPAG